MGKEGLEQEPIIETGTPDISQLTELLERQPGARRMLAAVFLLARRQAERKIYTHCAHVLARNGYPRISANILKKQLQQLAGVHESTSGKRDCALQITCWLLEETLPDERFDDAGREEWYAGVMHRKLLTKEELADTKRLLQTKERTARTLVQKRHAHGGGEASKMAELEAKLRAGGKLQ